MRILPISFDLQGDEAQHGHYNDGYSPYPTTSVYDQQSYHPDPFSSPHDHPQRPQSTGYPPQGEEYRSGYPPVSHDPYGVPYRQSPSPHHHEPYASTPYSPSHTIPPPPPPQPFHLQPQQQHPHVAFPPDQSFSSTDLNVPPPPPLSNQTSTTLFQPYGDPDNDLEDSGDFPLLRAPSGRSQESLSMNMPGFYDSQSINMPGSHDEDSVNNIRYGRIPQRVPRRHKTLKRVECVSCLCHPRMSLD